MKGEQVATSLNHEKFLANLDASEPYRWQVAQWLSGRGHVVRVPPLTKAETRENWEEAADSGDLEICLRVEVKHLSRDFTSRADWPFGTRFIVCGKNAFDRATPKPYGFIILNAAGTHAAMVLSSGQGKWLVDAVKDSRYAETQQFYFAPMEQVVFSKL